MAKREMRRGVCVQAYYISPCDLDGTELQALVNIFQDTIEKLQGRGYSHLRLRTELDVAGEVVAFNLVGDRLETEKEAERRARKEKKECEKRKATKESLKKKRYDMYLKLKTEFEEETKLAE